MEQGRKTGDLSAGDERKGRMDSKILHKGNIISSVEAKVGNIVKDYVNSVSMLASGSELSIVKFQELWRNLLAEIDVIVRIDLNLRVFENFDDSELVKATQKSYQAKGVSLKVNRKSEKSILCVDGGLNLTRTMLVPKEPIDKIRLWEMEKRKSLVPLDIMLGIENSPFKVSREMMAKIAHKAVSGPSYKRVADSLQEDFNFEICPETVRQITITTGMAVLGADLKSAEETWSNKGILSYSGKRKGDFIVFVDGSSVKIREYMADSENGRCYDKVSKECKLAVMVKSEDEIAGGKPGKKSNEATKYKNIEYVAFIGSVDVFSKLVLDSAVKSGLLDHENVVVSGDGASMINTVEKVLSLDLPVECMFRILDFWHLCDNTAKFSKGVDFPNEDARLAWVDEKCEQYRNGEVLEALRELRSEFEGVKGGDNVNLCHYVSENKNFANYPEYERMGFPIGSGRVEGGNKFVVQSRLKLVGMSWRLWPANAVLALKAKLHSGKWESCVVPLMQSFRFEHGIKYLDPQDAENKKC
jgi:hypothetical protein